MANSKSAEKRARQQAKRRSRNQVQRSKLKTAIKKVSAAKDADTATGAFRDTAAMLDRLAARRIIHPNKAARKKSQLARQVADVGGSP